MGPVNKAVTSAFATFSAKAKSFWLSGSTKMYEFLSKLLFLQTIKFTRFFHFLGSTASDDKTSTAPSRIAEIPSSNSSLSTLQIIGIILSKVFVKFKTSSNKLRLSFKRITIRLVLFRVFLRSSRVTTESKFIPASDRAS